MENGKDTQFFEGTEKLLEVWLNSTTENNNQADLRVITRLVCMNIVLFSQVTICKWILFENYRFKMIQNQNLQDV